MRLNDLINQELGRYRIEALVGRGGMAAVYRAFDTRLQRHVALKVLYPQYLADPDIVERFRREAVTAAQLDHPHIAPIYDVGEADGLIFLAMKLLPGPSLADVLQREQRLPIDRTIALTFELASALDEAHARGIVHRDIKPGNVLFDDRGRAILTDFGIAKSLDAPALTESSVIVGTPDYIAPEQIDPRLAPGGKLDYRADLYSLGALIFRTLTGRRPFDGSAQTVLIAHLRDDPPPPSSILPSLPAAADAVLLRAMAKQPAQRFASATELAHALGASISDQTEVGVVFPTPALRHEPHTRPTTQVVKQPSTASIPPADEAIQPVLAVKRPHRWAWFAALALVLLLGAGAARFVMADQPSAPALASGLPTTTSTLTPSATTAATTPPSTATLTPTSTTTAIGTTEPSATTTVHVVVAMPKTAPRTGQGTAPTPARQPTTRPVVQPPTQPTARPTARPTTRPTDAPTAAPTEQPTVAPTSTPAAARCTAALAGGFGHVWRTNAQVQSALSCPTDAERASYSVEQLFQGGAMYYRENTKEYWVFSADSGTWRRYIDVYEADPEPTEAPPEGLIAPVRGFGRLWQKYPEVRATLGWATTPEKGFTGVYQAFEHGTMLYSPALNGHDKRIYVLNTNATYRIFVDTYTGP